MAGPSFLTRWRERLPSRCAICASWPARPVCEACVARFAPPLPVPAGVAQCGECQRHPPPLDACIACCDYAWPWPERIGRFKFEGEAGWAAPLATLMRSSPWVEPTLEAAHCVLPMPMPMPMPLAAGRLREHGFNQALELAKRLAPPAKVDARLLLRVRETPPQSGLARAERLRNLRGAFALEPTRPDHSPCAASMWC